MSINESYNRNLFNISISQIDEFTKVKTSKALVAIALSWIGIGFFLILGKWILEENYYYLYIPIVFLIAGRQGALLQMVHEGAHMLISKNKKVNYFFSHYFCALPIGITHEGYARGHYIHHLHTGSELDPPSDRDKYRETDFKSLKVYKLLLKDLVGLSAIQVFLSYMSNSDSNTQKKKIEITNIAKKLLPLVSVQLVILVVFFELNLAMYILLWIIPAVSAHMVLMRIRGIAEHGLPNQLGLEIKNSEVGNFYTRSFLTSKNQYKFKIISIIEKLLIGSQSVFFHHEHHLMPNVPFYNLKKLNAVISDRVNKLNPDIYENGYFSAAFRSLLKK